jgi:uncharacterized protein YbjT (DUF2867 family)
MREPSRRRFLRSRPSFTSSVRRIPIRRTPPSSFASISHRSAPRPPLPRAHASHIVYISVAHPAPVMRAYVAARVEGEALVAASGIAATILRPWYVLGPGHRWPIVLAPLYALFRMIPATRASAQRPGLVTPTQVTATIVHAVANPPPSGLRIVEVP